MTPALESPEINQETLSHQLGKVRHDLRNPLSDILGFSEMLLEETAASGHLNLTEQLRAIHQVASQVLKQVNQQLSLDTFTAKTSSSAELLALIEQTSDIVLRHASQLSADLARMENPALAEDLARIKGAARQLRDMAGPLLATLDKHGARNAPCAHPEPSRLAGLPARLAAKPLAGVTAQWGRVLIVDDNQSNCALLKRRLEREGFATMTAANGREALELLTGQAYDLVLLDIMMPEVNGFQVLETMKANGLLGRTPVIVLSASDETAGVAHCIEMGAEDYLPKPFDPVLLRARIGACLEKKRLRDRERAAYDALERSQQRLAGELAKAANYVRSLLPAPVQGRIETHWCFHPSEQLGGDAFGYHWIDDDHLGIYLLDVCGHGVGAALLSVAVLNTLRAQTLPQTNFRDPQAVLTALNSVFLMEQQNYLYFTLWYGVYCPSRRELRYGSGGHPPALLLHIDPDAAPSVIPLATAGPAIGCFEGSQFASAVQAVPPQTRLQVFSDGVYEIFLPDGRVQTWEAYLDGFQRAEVVRMRPEERLQQALALRGLEVLEDDYSLLEIRFP